MPCYEFKSKKKHFDCQAFDGELREIKQLKGNSVKTLFNIPSELFKTESDMDVTSQDKAPNFKHEFLTKKL